MATIGMALPISAAESSEATMKLHFNFCNFQQKTRRDVNYISRAKKFDTPLFFITIDAINSCKFKLDTFKIDR